MSVEKGNSGTPETQPSEPEHTPALSRGGDDSRIIPLGIRTAAILAAGLVPFNKGKEGLESGQKVSNNPPETLSIEGDPVAEERARGAEERFEEHINNLE